MDMSKNDPRFTRLSEMLAVNQIGAKDSKSSKGSKKPESKLSTNKKDDKQFVIRGMLMTLEIPVELPDQTTSPALAFLDS
jgi:hypothetical protein